MKLCLLQSSLSCLLILCGNTMAHSHAHTNEHHHASNNVSNEYTHIECTIVPINHMESSCSHPHIPGPRSVRTPSNQTTNTNWSGYVAANNFKAQ